MLRAKIYARRVQHIWQLVRELCYETNAVSAVKSRNAVLVQVVEGLIPTYRQARQGHDFESIADEIFALRSILPRLGLKTARVERL